LLSGSQSTTSAFKAWHLAARFGQLVAAARLRGTRDRLALGHGPDSGSSRLSGKKSELGRDLLAVAGHEPVTTAPERRDDRK